MNSHILALAKGGGANGPTEPTSTETYSIRLDATADLEEEEEEEELLGDPFHLRPMLPADIPAIRTWHEEWFPVRYQDDFYEALAATAALNEKNQKLPPTSRSLPRLSPVLEEQERSGSSHRQQPLHLTASRSSTAEDLLDSSDDGEEEDPICASLNDDDDNDSPENEGLSHPLYTMVATCKGKSTIGEGISSTTPKDVIAGCLVASLYPASSCRSLPSNNAYRHNYPSTKQPQCLYLMTLGIAPDYRRMGLAQRLVVKAMDDSSKDNHLVAVYLHVLDTNTAAQQLYRRMGFRCMSKIVDYYTLGDDESRDCYVYAYYLNHDNGELLSWVSSAVVWGFKTVWSGMTWWMGDNEEGIDQAPSEPVAG